MPGRLNGASYPDTDDYRSIPNAPPGVVAMKLHTTGKKEPICEACGKPIKHPSEYWGCGAGWFKPKRGVRHPDGMVYWHDECLKS